MPRFLPSGFLCLWLPDFPAWAAQAAQQSTCYSAPLRADRQDNETTYRTQPRDWEQPLVVHHKGRAIALSLEAHQRGLRCGWTVHQVRALAPDTILLPYDAAASDFAWEQVLLALYDYSPCIEAVTPGLAFSTAPTRPEVRAALQNFVGAIGARCGVAVDRPTAHLAALTAAPGVVRAIRPEVTDKFLASVPVLVLSEAGLDEKIVERLSWFGIECVGQLRCYSRRQLAEQFGKNPLLWYFSSAGTPKADQRPVATFQPPPAIEVRLAFEQPAIEVHQCLPTLHQLLQQAHEELRGRGASNLSLAIETGAGRRATSRLLREPVRQLRPLRDLYGELFSALIGAQLKSRNTSSEIAPEISALSLRLGQLSQGTEQGVLFETPENQARQRIAALEMTAQSLEKRHPGALKQIRPLHLHSPLPEERFTTAPALPIIEAYHCALLGHSTSGSAAAPAIASRRTGNSKRTKGALPATKATAKDAIKAGTKTATKVTANATAKALAKAPTAAPTNQRSTNQRRRIAP